VKLCRESRGLEREPERLGVILGAFLRGELNREVSRDVGVIDGAAARTRVEERNVLVRTADRSGAPESGSRSRSPKGLAQRVATGRRSEPRPFYLWFKSHRVRLWSHLLAVVQGSRWAARPSQVLRRSGRSV
jgi:hypothetical protein